jgi:hypothetical protein
MSRKFNLTLFRPDHPRFRIMDSHLEVMDSLKWGFEALGIDCSININRFDRQRTNIVFGWIIAAQMGGLDEMPDDTILYNFEQFSERQLVGTGMAQLAQRFQIWDYSAANLPQWLACNPRFTPFHAPVSYAPTLTRIADAAEPDIDLLFIGSTGPARNGKLYDLSVDVHRPGLVVLQNIWGAQRDAFIGRSRLLLNLSGDSPNLRIFEIVRVSYYLANRKAVVCEDRSGQFVEDDMKGALLFAPTAELAGHSVRLLQDPAERQQWAERGFEAFRQRDVRDLLRHWLG